MVSGITPETVTHLVAAGADIFAKDKDGKIPFDYLCEYGKCENRHFSEGLQPLNYLNLRMISIY